MNGAERPLRALLVSMRDRDDPMAAQERRCFCDKAGLTTLEVVYAVDGRLGARELDAQLLFFGGSGAYSVLDSADWIRRLMDFLPQVLARDVPAWASCFAFQGLALALGGTVRRDERRQQLGAHVVRLTVAGQTDQLFARMPETFRAQFGHHDHVVRLPSGVTALALGNGDTCQAFRVDGTSFWGAQFHPELDKQSTIERWNHYRTFYAGDEGEAIDRRLAEAPETPEVHQLLRALVELARYR